MSEILVAQGSLEYDFEAAKEYLNGQLELYRGMVFTEDKKKEAKETVAELRKEKKAFQDRCKEVKKEYLKPLDDFMDKASKLSDMYDEPINFINDQISAFEAERIAEKRKAVSDIYDEFVPEEDIREIIPLTKIYDSHWDNTTFSMNSIKDGIMGYKETVKNGLTTLKSMNSEAEDKALETFKQTLDLTKAILVITDYEAQKREIVERERARIKAEEEERIRRDERAKIAAEEEKAVAVEQARAEVVDFLTPKDIEAPVKRYIYNIALTPDAKEKLETYMNSVGIEFDLC